MPILAIRHLTRYRYRNPAAMGERRMMFRLRERYDQRLIASDFIDTAIEVDMQARPETAMQPPAARAVAIA